MFYLVKTPFWLKAMRPSYLWRVNTTENVLYLTFDDGPHPTVTPFVLDELKRYGAKATFFCIGKNVAAHEDIYLRIIQDGHAVGNHTYDHLNGWKTPEKKYLDNIAEAARYVDSHLFRPPYGRITRSQGATLQKGTDGNPFKIVMWDVLSGDFDVSLGKQKCLRNVVRYSTGGSVIVFHDSAKAWERLAFVLPEMLKYFSERGYRFEKL